MNASNSIRVYCRILGGRNRGNRITIEPGGVVGIRNRQGLEEKKYELDGVFKDEDSQFDLYKVLGIPTVTSLLKGGNCTIISCGGEGTGKTYTLFGRNPQSLSSSDDQRGLVVRIIDSAVNRMQNRYDSCSSQFSIDIVQALFQQGDVMVDTLAGFPASSASLKSVSCGSDGEEDPFVSHWSSVLSGFTVISCHQDKEEAYRALSYASQTAAKGDRATIVRFEWTTQRDAAPRAANLLFLDCSPVYSKASHNLRDVVSYLALRVNSHRSMPHQRLNLISLLRSDFAHLSDSSTKVVVHCKDSNLDLDVFDSSSILSFGVLVKKIPRKRSAKVELEVNQGKDERGATEKESGKKEVEDAKDVSNRREEEENAKVAPVGLESTTQKIFTVYLSNLTRQLRQAEEECQQEREKAERTEKNLAREREENARLRQKLEDNSAAEAKCRSPKGHIDNHQKGCPLYAYSLLSTLSGGDRRHSAPCLPACTCGEAMDESDCERPTGCELHAVSPGHQQIRADPLPGPLDPLTQCCQDNDNDDDTGSGGSTLEAVDCASLSSGDENERIDEETTTIPDTHSFQHQHIREKMRKYRMRVQKLLRMLRKSRQETLELNKKLEESERQKQDAITKYISSVSRLEESRRWMRRLKKSLQSEKEQLLPQLNGELKLRVVEQELGAKERENKKLQESVQSLQSMVSHLSAEYNRRVQTEIMMKTSKDYGNLDIDELVSENSALKDNISSVMKIMEHCYTENTQLTTYSNTLSTKLAQANAAIASLEHHVLQGERTEGEPTPRHSPLDTPRSRAGWSTGQAPEVLI